MEMNINNLIDIAIQGLMYILGFVIIILGLAFLSAHFVILLLILCVLAGLMWGFNTQLSNWVKAKIKPLFRGRDNGKNT